LEKSEGKKTEMKMSSRSERAVEDFSKGCNCSQAVFCAFAEDLGLEDKLAIKIASGFGGGIGRGGDICGAVTGAVMVLGLKYFLPEADIQQSKAKVYEIVKEFKKMFKKRHGSIVCRELVGCNLSTEEGFENFLKQDLHNNVCVGLVKDAVEIVEKL